MKLGVRHLVAFWAFLGMILTYMIRINLSVAIVAMAKPLPAAEQSTECPAGTQNTTLTDGYDWSRQTQGLVLSAFYIGYVILQIPTGWLVRKIGSKILFGGGLLGASILTMFIPVAAQYGAGWVILTRALMGLFEGTTWPANHALWSAWAPADENTFLLNFVFSGTHLGSILSLLITGMLVQYGPFGGWPSAFYFFGGAGVVWFCGWAFFVTSQPDDHRFISKEEVDHIHETCHKHKLVAIPWKSIFTSRAVWAVTIAHGVFNWPFYTLLAGLPLYLNDMLHMSGDKIGMASAVPYVMLFFSQSGSGMIIDKFRHRFSTTTVRKGAYSGGLLMSSLFLALLSFVGCSLPATLILLTLSLMFAGMAYAGFSPLHLDIAPEYAGLLMGISNTAGTASGILAPSVMGRLLKSYPGSTGWTATFLLAAGIGAVGAIVFALIGTAEREPWSKDDEEEDTKEASAKEATAPKDATKQELLAVNGEAQDEL